SRARSEAPSAHDCHTGPVTSRQSSRSPRLRALPFRGLPTLGGSMLACVRSAMLFGVEGLVVDVQVHVSTGLPSYTFVGLPDAAVRESRDRVRAALLSSGLSWPQRRVNVNLAPR